MDLILNQINDSFSKIELSMFRFLKLRKHIFNTLNFVTLFLSLMNMNKLFFDWKKKKITSWIGVNSNRQFGWLNFLLSSLSSLDWSILDNKLFWRQLCGLVWRGGWPRRGCRRARRCSPRSSTWCTRSAVATFNIQLYGTSDNKLDRVFSFAKWSSFLEELPWGNVGEIWDQVCWWPSSHVWRNCVWDDFLSAQWRLSSKRHSVSISVTKQEKKWFSKINVSRSLGAVLKWRHNLIT